MISHKHWILLPAVIAVILGAAAAGGGEDAASQMRALGKDLFLSHCASCHGADGKGGGPVAAALKEPPGDLTRIRERHGGKFPRLTIEEIIDGQRLLLAHGSREMPIWGRELARGKGPHRAGADVFALAEYLESIQSE